MRYAKISRLLDEWHQEFFGVSGGMAGGRLKRGVNA